MKREIKDFLKEQNLDYKDLNLYKRAFTHTSFINETNQKIMSYENLEFFGDTVLDLVVAKYLFDNFPNKEPGELHLLKASLVNKKFLANVGRNLNFEWYIKLGQGETNKILSDSLYEDILEALIASIYLDLGLIEVTKFIYKYITSQAKRIDMNNLKDYKTKLQEHLQSEKGKSVIYVSKKDPNSNLKTPQFISEAIFENQILGTGKGSSKKDAEKQAAQNAYKRMVN